MRIVEDALVKESGTCNCEVIYELDWIIDDNTVVRPDVMIVCGKFDDDFLRFPPSLILEITSKSTQMADRNVKRKLYESQKVPYYLIADSDRKITEVFEFVGESYQPMKQSFFALTATCQFQLRLDDLWV